MKTLGLLLVVAGVALCASVGARTAPSMHEYLVRSGRAVLTAKEGEKPAEVSQPPGPKQRLQEWFEANGALFGLGLVLLFGGSIVARGAARAERHAAGSEGGERHGGAVDLGAALEALAGEVDELAEEAENLAHSEQPPRDEVAELKRRIEAIQLERIEPIVDSRVQLEVRYGLAGFASVFGPFSSGERKVNRAWSALVDGHLPETAASLASAAAEFRAARQRLGELAAASH